jgi:hypothetical protein
MHGAGVTCALQRYYASRSVPYPESSYEQVDDLYHPHLFIGTNGVGPSRFTRVDEVRCQLIT